ncbi:unnamed protein product [Caretta caretta]
MKADGHSGLWSLLSRPSIPPADAHPCDSAGALKAPKKEGVEYPLKAEQTSSGEARLCLRAIRVGATLASESWGEGPCKDFKQGAVRTMTRVNFSGQVSSIGVVPCDSSLCIGVNHHTAGHRRARVSSPLSLTGWLCSVQGNRAMISVGTSRCY